MAERIIRELVDDLDGSPAEHRTELGFDGETYILDLSDPNMTELRLKLAPYLAAGQRQRRGVAPARPAARTPRAGGQHRNRAEAQAIRAWAVANGFVMRDRGRIPYQVEEAYANRHVVGGGSETGGNKRPVKPTAAAQPPPEPAPAPAPKPEPTPEPARVDDTWSPPRVVTLQEIKVWLQARGVKIPRNYISWPLMEQYENGHPNEKLVMPEPGSAIKGASLPGRKLKAVAG